MPCGDTVWAVATSRWLTSESALSPPRIALRATQSLQVLDAPIIVGQLPYQVKLPELIVELIMFPPSGLLDLHRDLAALHKESHQFPQMLRHTAVCNTICVGEGWWCKMEVSSAVSRAACPGGARFTQAQASPWPQA